MGWINSIAYGFFMIGYAPLVLLPLLIIGWVVKAYQLISFGLPQYLLFGVPFGGSINNIKLPYLFARLAIISILIFAVLFVLSAIKVHFQKNDQPNPIRIAMKNSIFGTLWLLGIPIALFLFNTIFGIILSLVLGSNNDSIDKTLFLALYNDSWSNKISFQTWIDISNSGFKIPMGVYSKFDWGEGIMLWLTGGIICFPTLIPFIFGMLVLVQKIFQQFFLFVISPFIAAASVADDGKRMKQFQEMYASKSFAILGLVVGVQLYSVFIGRAMNWIRGLNNIDFFGKLILILAITAGGAIAAKGITSEVSAFIGESASIRETMGETKNLIGSSMAMAGGVGAVGRLGKKAFMGTGNKILGKSQAWARFAQGAALKKKLKSDLKSGKIGLQQYQSKLQEWKDVATAQKIKEKEMEKFEKQNLKEYQEQEKLPENQRSLKFQGLDKKEMKMSYDQLLKRSNKEVKNYEKLAKKAQKSPEKITNLERAKMDNSVLRIKNLERHLNKKAPNMGVYNESKNKYKKSEFKKEIDDNFKYQKTLKNSKK